MLSVIFYSLVSCNTEQESYTVSLDSKAIYNSRIAKQVRLSPKADVVILEGRNFTGPFTGIIESDCIDPGDMENLMIRNPDEIE